MKEPRYRDGRTEIRRAGDLRDAGQMILVMLPSGRYGVRIGKITNAGAMASAMPGGAV